MVPRLLIWVVVCAAVGAPAGAVPPASGPDGALQGHPPATKPSGDEDFHLSLSSTLKLEPSSLICGSDGRVTYCLEGQEGQAILPPETTRRIGQAVAGFIQKPAPFAVVFSGSVDGGSREVLARAGTVARLCWVYHWDVPEELIALAEAVRQAISESAMDQKQKVTLELVLNEIVRPVHTPVAKNPLEFRQVTQERCIVIPNGEPAALVAAVAGKPDTRWDSHHRIEGFYRLSTLPDPAMGEELWKAYLSHPEYDSDTKLQVLAASIQGGCAKGMRAYATRASSGSELARFMGEIVSETTLSEVARRAGVAKVEKATAVKAWTWLVSNAEKLRFDPQTRTYSIAE